MTKKARMINLTERQTVVKRINIYFGHEQGDENYPFSTHKTIAIREIIDNGIDAIRKNNIKNGYLRVTFNKDGSVECYDNGGGFPTEIIEDADGVKMSELYMGLGKLNAGTNFDEVSDSLGTNGVGGSGSQMLSEYTKVEVYKNKTKIQLDFNNAQPGIFDKNGEFKEVKDYTFLQKTKDDRPKEEKAIFPNGTKILIKLNDELFKTIYGIDYDDLIARMRGTAILVRGITIEVINHHRLDENNNPQHEIFYFEGGINQVLESKANFITPLIEMNNKGYFKDETIDVKDGKSIKKTIDKEARIEFVFAYDNRYNTDIETYVNTIKTRLHGIHLETFEKALVEVFNNKFRSIRNGLTKKDKDPIINDYHEGLYAIISVYLPEPEFTAQIKSELGGKKAQKEFYRQFKECFEKFVDSPKNNDTIRIIADKVILAMRNRTRIQEEKEFNREKNKIERNNSFPPKLLDCRFTHDEKSELFIVEGDSAKGGLEAARNSDYQALIPIRGKLINTLKASDKKILENQEIKDIIKCLDCGIGDNYNSENLRYKRIIIATDADSDGQNIFCLLLTFFWRYFPNIIKEGRLYKACTPLFIVSHGKEKYYFYSKKEFDNAMNNEFKNKKVNIVRAKGLGETGAETLEYTGMNPETRTIERIIIDNIEDDIKYLEIAMGEDTSIRKEWIKNNPVELEGE